MWLPQAKGRKKAGEISGMKIVIYVGVRAFLYFQEGVRKTTRVLVAQEHTKALKHNKSKLWETPEKRHITGTHPNCAMSEATHYWNTPALW